MKKYNTIEEYFNDLYRHIEKIAEEYPSTIRTYLDHIRKPRTIEEAAKQCSEITKTISYEIKKDKEIALTNAKKIKKLGKGLDDI